MNQITGIDLGHMPRNSDGVPGITKSKLWFKTLKVNRKDLIQKHLAEFYVNSSCWNCTRWPLALAEELPDSQLV